MRRRLLLLGPAVLVASCATVGVARLATLPAVELAFPAGASDHAAPGRAADEPGPGEAPDDRTAPVAGPDDETDPARDADRADDPDGDDADEHADVLAAADAEEVGDDLLLEPAGLPREVVLDVHVAGTRRPVLVVRPPEHRRRAPAVIALHGRGGTGASMRAVGLEPWASTAGALVAYPDGLGGSWNDDRPGLEPPVVTDDVAFLDALVDALVTEEDIDRRRVALVGFSNGALMTSRYACERSERLAAAVLVGAGGPAGLGERCRPARPVPVFVVAGTADAVVPYEGGVVAGPARGAVAAIAEVLAVWRRIDGCSSFELTTGPGDVERLRGVECNEGTEVRHDRVVGGGHVWAWPGYDTTAEVGAFLRRNLGRRPGGPRLERPETEPLPSDQ